MVAMEACSKKRPWFCIDLNLKINRQTTGRLPSCSQDCRSSSSFLAKFLNSTASSCDEESEQDKLLPLEKRKEFEVRTEPMKGIFCNSSRTSHCGDLICLSVSIWSAVPKLS